MNADNKHGAAPQSGAGRGVGPYNNVLLSKYRHAKCIEVYIHVIRGYLYIHM